MRRILVADDESVTRHFLARVVSRWGYAVETVSTGTQALSALMQDDGPSLAVVDWMMPGVQGPEICRALRTLRHRYVYTILLTSKNETSDLVAGLDAGADDYLVKPFQTDELEARLRAGMRIVTLEEELRRRATHDALTGVLGRAAIFDLLSREVERARRSGGPVGVMMLDLDHFKRVNDVHGHGAGDAVLKWAAAKFRHAVRGYDGVGRYGGEEFLVVAPECDAVTARIVATRICASIASAPCDVGTTSVPVTVSIGVAAGPIGGLGPEALLRTADEALYRAKHAGRARVEVTPVVPPDGRGSVG